MSKLSLCIFAILLLCIVQGIRGQCPHAQTLTLFSSLPQWNVQGANLIISSAVKVDQTSSAILRSIIIANGGSLIFDDKVLNLNVEFIRVDKGGKFIAGSSNCPIKNKITITFYGNRTTENVIGSDPHDNQATGAKGFAVMSGSTLQLHGEVNRPTWTNLAETVVKGSNQLRTIDATQWKVGDKIVLASTDFNEVVPSSARQPSWMTGQRFPDQNEERTIISVLNSRTFIVDQPFNYTHWGKDFQRAEVGILNRNIVFRGDDSSVTQGGYGGHIMIRLLDNCEISGIEVTRMGQKGVMGRYSVHFHLLAYHTQNIGKQFYFKDSSIHHSFQRCVVVHDSNGLLIKDNVCFDAFGHQYFLEDGPENGNEFIHNLGIRPRPVPAGDPHQLIPSDHDVSVFWITNPNNTWIGNAAVGGKFGYWFTMPINPTGLSSSTYGTSVNLRRLPLGGFSNNTVHSCFTGFMIDDMLKPDGTTELASYSPPTVTWFDGLIAYKNRDRGVWVRGGPIGYTNFIVMDNRIGFISPPGPNALTNSLFVGESDNVGEALRTIDVGGRSRPGLNGFADIIKGYDTYDNGGPQYLRNVTFLNFVTNQFRRAGALGQLMNAPFKHQTLNRYIDLKFDQATNRAYIHNQPNDANRGSALLDIDGSVTGRSPGGWIISNDTLLHRKGCTGMPLWQGFNCPVALEGYAQFSVFNLGGQFHTESDSGSYPELNTRSRTVERMYTHDLTRGISSPVIGAFSSSDGNFYLHSNLLVRNFYALRWAFNIPTPQALRLRMASSVNNEWIVVTVQYPRTATFDVTWASNSQSIRQPMRQASSLQEILDDQTLYYYDSVGENLFVHLRNRVGRTSFSERFNFVSYNFDGFNVIINATCPNNRCAVDDYSLPKNADKFIKMYNREDRFAAVLQPCQISSSMSNVKGSGVAFAVLLPNRRTLDVTVHHDLSLIASGMSIGIGEPGSEEKFLSQVGVRYSPFSMSRFSIDLSYNEIVDLLKGKVFIKLHTTDYPNGHLRGQLLCNHGVRSNGHAACQVPLRISAAKPCDPVSNAFEFYTDIEQAARSSYSIGRWSDTVVNGNFTESPICGTSSIRASIWRGGFQVSKLFRVGGPYNWVDLSVYKFFEFFVRGITAGQTTLNIYFTEVINDATTDRPQMLVDTRYIQHFKIDETTVTRVRIPVSDYPFTNRTSLNAIQRVGFTLNNAQAQGTRELLFDNLRFVTGDNDKLEENTFDTAQIVSFDKKLGICNAANVANPDLDPLNVRLTGEEVSAEESAIIPSNSNNSTRTNNANTPMIASLIVGLVMIVAAIL